MATYVRRRSRWLIAGGIVAALVLCAGIGMLVIYPRVGASMVRKKLTDYLATKLGRTIEVADVDVSYGHAVLRDIAVKGPLDGETPLVHVDRIDVDFDGLHSLIGQVRLGAAKIDGVIVAVRRGGDGVDNVRDVVDRLRAKTPGDTEGKSHLRPTSIAITHGKLIANDELTGATALIADGDATWTAERLVAEARNVTATTLNAPKASATKITIEKRTGETPSVAIDGGELALWPQLALSGIAGTVAADPAKPGQYRLDVAGGYGGVPGRLWTAKGQLDPVTLAGAIDLEAAKFQLDRLAPLLEHSAVVDYQATSVDTAVHVDFDPTGAKFSGTFHLRGLNVGHPMIADKEVHDLDLSAQVGGSFDRATHKLELTRGDFVARDVPFSITGTIIQPPRTALPEVPVVAATGDGPTPPMRGPHGVQNLKLRLVIPPIDCQRVINAIPTEMAPYIAGYKLRGVFDTDITLDVDWAKLDETVLGGHVGIDHCRVVDEPADSPKRLKDEFEHYVELEKGQWTSFVVGPTNEDYVPIEDISQFVIKSIISTEDSAFYHHKGFITSEFRTALVNDLKASGFKFGASSITMQMVKNVLLYREKTLARKLQELFLTWHVENTLTKDRIMEIYLNVIEYGPGLYGIGPAAKHYFGKPAKDLNAVEAAFFSTILPNPKDRYKQYCAGTLTKWTSSKIERILNIMLKRDRLTQAEYDTAMATPLLFVKDGSETEEDCLKRVKKAIKNARSTNPNAPPDPSAPAVAPHHHPTKKKQKQP